MINACHAAILEDWSKEGIIIDSKGQHELLNHQTSLFSRLAELEARETHYKAMAQEASESQHQVIAKNGQVIAKIMANNFSVSETKMEVHLKNYINKSRIFVKVIQSLQNIFLPQKK